MGKTLKTIKFIARFRRKTKQMFKSFCEDCKIRSAQEYKKNPMHTDYSYLCNDCKEKADNTLKKLQEEFEQ